MSHQFTERLLRKTSELDLCECIHWTEDGEFFVICNDVFFWACADAEEIATDEDLKMLESSLNDAGYSDALLLYCARKRSMRPQGAMYGHIEKKNWSLFDECGPERDPSEPGNTPKPKAA